MSHIRKPLLTSRQVGIAAVFGGIAFAWRALGLVIPVAPPFVIDLREAFLLIGAGAGGPIVGVTIGILCALPSGLPILDLYYYVVLSLFWCLVYKRLYRMKRILRPIIAYIYLWIVEAGPIYLVYIPAGDFIFHLWAWWPFYFTWIFSPGFQFIYLLIQVVTLTIAWEVAPSFMEPAWEWRRK